MRKLLFVTALIVMAMIGATAPASAMDPAIDIQKNVNGEDANTAPGPGIPVDAMVLWTYMVTNIGDETLNNVYVLDDHGVTVTCPKITLEPGESMTCTGSGKAVAGPYSNIGTASGRGASETVTDSDPAHYYGTQPGIFIEKSVNGVDADTAPGPTISTGSPILWTYVVTNSGDIELTDVTVTDNRGVTVTCPKTTLQVGESMTCTGSGIAVAGQYSNIGTASGTSISETMNASDACFYFGGGGNQGCEKGYWKKHPASWPPTGYSPGQMVKSVFPSVTIYFASLENTSLFNALSFTGGAGNEKAAKILLRAAIVALLNAAHPDIAYPRTEAQVIADVNTALLQNRDAMVVLAEELDESSKLGCPLN